jgi:hypothetical protein
MPEPINDQSFNPDAPTLRAALDSKRDALTNMAPADVIEAPRLDASLAAGIVIGSLPRIAKHRDEIVAQFGDAGAAVIDDLPVVAYATEQSQIELAAAEDDSDLREMSRDLAEEHQLLVTDADALANRKVIERTRIDAGRSVQGYRTLVNSTLVLVSMFRSSWSSVEGKTPLTAEDLDRIEIKAQRMLKRLHERDQRSTRMPAVDLRARALTMLIRRYAEARRMITYVRWSHEDADEIAPSLYSGRRGRNKRGSEPEIVVGGDVDGGEVEPGPFAPTPLPIPTPDVDVPNNGGAPFTA